MIRIPLSVAGEEKKVHPKAPRSVTHTDMMKCCKYICYSDATEDLENLSNNNLFAKYKGKIVDVKFHNLSGVSKITVNSNGRDFWTYYPEEGEGEIHCPEWTGLEHLPTSTQLFFSNLFFSFTPRILANGETAKITGQISYRNLFDVSPIAALQAIPIVHYTPTHTFAINSGSMAELEGRFEFGDHDVVCDGYTDEEVQAQIDYLLSPKDFEPTLIAYSDVPKELDRNPDFKEAWFKQLNDMMKIVNAYKRPEGLKVYRNGAEVPEGGELFI